MKYLVLRNSRMSTHGRFRMLGTRTTESIHGSGLYSTPWVTLTISRSVGSWRDRRLADCADASRSGLSGRPSSEKISSSQRSITSAIRRASVLVSASRARLATWRKPGERSFRNWRRRSRSPRRIASRCWGSECARKIRLMSLEPSCRKRLTRSATSRPPEPLTRPASPTSTWPCLPATLRADSRSLTDPRRRTDLNQDSPTS